MPLLSWSENYSVKVPTFDKQHQVLFDLINRLHDAMRIGKGNSALGSVLAELSKYTVAHFAAEESAMERNAYPAFKEHHAQHSQFIKRMTDFSNEFTAGRVALSTTVIDFLMDWLKLHIVGTDKKYSDFLVSRGVV